MRRGTAAAAACTALLAAGLAACGDEGAPVSAAPAPPAKPTRAELLATCPAKAPSWEHDGFRPPAGTDDPGFLRLQDSLTRAADIAGRYLATLPADQAGELRLDYAGPAVVVQVTRDAEAVRRELRNRIGDGVQAEVETVRYSLAELRRASDTILAIRAAELTGVGAGANGRVEVQVAKAEDIPATTALIAKSVDPCMFTVTQGGPFTPWAGGAADPPAPATGAAP